MSQKESHNSSGDPRLVVYTITTVVFHAWSLATRERNNHVWVRAVLLGLRCCVMFLPSPRFQWIKRKSAGLFLAYLVYLVASRSPCIWDSDSWAMQVDAVLALWLLLTSNNSSDVTVVFQTQRDMFAWFYFCAGFWKLNSHFWDSDASCASVFFMQLLAYYIAPFLPNEATTLVVAKYAKWMAPAATLFIELAQGGLMLGGMMLNKRTLERYGVLCALVFHLAVCMTPRPNDISGFALRCSARLVCFCSVQGTKAAIRVVRARRNELVAIAVAMGAIGYSTWTTPNNWAFALFAVTGGFVFLAVWCEDECDSLVDESTTTTTRKRLWWSYIGSGFAFVYAFGGIMTGLQEEATPNMFANLKIHGGSNHWILPTGLLFHIYGDYPDSHPFGGGVIRIENTTSDWLKAVYPADLTHLLQPPMVAELLAKVGIPRPSFFNPGALRVAGIFIDTPPKHFYRYTVPALEMKRLLSEAKRKDRDFELTYVQLPGTKGDEAWRAFAVKRTVFVKVEDGNVVECESKLAGSDISAPCETMDLPMLSDDAVPAILNHLSMYHAYPITTDDKSKLPKSIACFGP